MVLHGYASHWCDNTVDSSHDIPDSHASGNGDNMVLCPVVGDQSCLSEDSKESSTIQCRAPYPMTCDLAISLDKITMPDKFTPNVEHDGMIDSVGNPL